MPPSVRSKYGNTQIHPTLGPPPRRSLSVPTAAAVSRPLKVGRTTPSLPPRPPPRSVPSLASPTAPHPSTLWSNASSASLGCKREVTRCPRWEVLGLEEEVLTHALHVIL
uniref:Uncharacterized protein n=1 Tax=Setaria viridis TaxID=4556 RepID=A0A4U6U8S4_SETVI|nr:hypothetical protein SEVIR_7G253700v2 [Setaria viridis]